MNLISSDLRQNLPPTDKAHGPKSAESGDVTPLLLEYLRIALRRRYVIAAAMAACLAIGLVVTLLMTPQYTASAVIEISRESNQITDFQGVERDTTAADQEFYQTQYGLLQSRSLSERVAAQLQLMDDPAFFELFGVAPKGAAFEKENGRYSGRGRKMRQRIAGEVLRAQLEVAPTRLSRLVEIKFTSPNSSFSTRVANAWVENFIKVNLERKVQATAYGRDMLRSQLAQAKERLDESQRQLVGYASSQRIINLPSQSSDGASAGRSIVADELASLNAALAVAAADRIQAEARYNTHRDAQASSETLQNSAINGLRLRRAELSAEYERLMTQFEPEYAPARALQSQIQQIDRSIRREEKRVADSLLAEFREAQGREAALGARVEELKSDYLNVQNRSIQYNIYQQEVDTNRALYDALLQRYKEIGVAGGVGVNNVAIVDRAELPQRPSSPRLALNLAIALVAGIVIGGLLAFVLEQIDESIDDPREIERRLGLPLLGAVPRVEGARPDDALRDRKSELVEAYLAVQTSLAFVTEHGIPRSIAVTSTRPAEGKSTTSLALATMLARSQRKVILIDGDMRSPSVHILGGVGHDRGLSNFLAGEENIASLTFDMSDFGLTAMSAGPLPPNAAELLIGNRMSLLVTRLLETYDHVVIDSPPVMGLADAPLIASHVEGVIYAIESHGIGSSQVKTALNRLTHSNARVFGAVLTKFQSKKSNYGYEYGYGYGRDARAEAKRSQEQG